MTSEQRRQLEELKALEAEELKAKAEAEEKELAEKCKKRFDATPKEIETALTVVSKVRATYNVKPSNLYSWCNVMCTSQAQELYKEQTDANKARYRASHDKAQQPTQSQHNPFMM